MSAAARLNILYTNIGRGHPYYLDGIVDRLEKKAGGALNLKIIDVFSLSKGLSLSFWRLADFLYRQGSQGGMIGGIYGAIRKRRIRRSSGLFEKRMAAGVRQYLKQYPYRTLVAHPLLAAMILDIVPVYYQHGEIAVPDEAIVSGVEEIFAPIADSVACFSRGGVDESRLFVTGLCIEPQLAEKAEMCFMNRCARFSSQDELVGGFFSSGAEPKEHVRKIILALRSLREGGQKALVFCARGGRLEQAICESGIKRLEGNCEGGSMKEALAGEQVLAISHGDRREETEVTCRAFDLLDYFVAPSHERTGWAAGLGLPLFILHPLIGTFSPLNRRFLISHDMAAEIVREAEAAVFSKLLSRLRANGLLLRMARNGFGKYPINGFDVIAGHLMRRLGEV
jgi:hypothetical protein